MLDQHDAYADADDRDDRQALRDRKTIRVMSLGQRASATSDAVWRRRHES